MRRKMTVARFVRNTKRSLKNSFTFTKREKEFFEVVGAALGMTTVLLVCYFSLIFGINWAVQVGLLNV